MVGRQFFNAPGTAGRHADGYLPAITDAAYRYTLKSYVAQERVYQLLLKILRVLGLHFAAPALIK